MMPIDNPLLWYHLVGQSAGKLRKEPALAVAALAIVVIAVALIAIPLKQAGGFDPGTLVMFQLIIATFVAPPLCGPIFAADYEKGSWDAIVVTRLTAKQILIGKLGSRFFLIGALLACFFVFQALNLGAVGGRPPILNVALANLVVYSWTALIVAFCCWISYRSRTAISALIGSYLTLFILLLAVPFIVSLIEAIVSGFGAGGFVASRVIESVHPYNAATVAMDSNRDPATKPFDSGLLQSIAYAGLSMLFAYSTLRSIRRQWRKS